MGLIEAELVPDIIEVGIKPSALAATVLPTLFIADIDPVLWWRAEHWTAAGERRSVRLPEGSVVHLNSRTAITSHYTKAERRIELLAGEAEFVVREDVRRPFVVAAGAARIEALGTDFLVRRDADGTSVAVIESAVQVNHAQRGAARTVRGPERGSGAMSGRWERYGPRISRV